MNKVTLVGNIVADPKETLISNGGEKSAFTIAVRDARNFQETYFLPCIAWKPLSTFINANVKKGDLVTVDGRLTRRAYTPMDGKTIYVTEVVVDSFQTLRRSANNIANSETIPTGNSVRGSEPTPKSDNGGYQSTPTNLDTVFNNSTYEDNNNQDDQNDDIDWDSEFN